MKENVKRIGILLIVLTIIMTLPAIVIADDANLNEGAGEQDGTSQEGDNEAGEGQEEGEDDTGEEGGDTSPAEITITLDKSLAEIEVGETVQLTATTNSEKTVEWTSSVETIATVNQTGLVTGVSKGTVTITATVEGKTATCTVTVKEVQEPEPEVIWTDFSHATFELKKIDTNINGAEVLISGVSPREGRRYRLLITADSAKPDIPNSWSDSILLSFDGDRNCFVSDDVAGFVELNQDLYVSVLESTR